MSGGSCSHLRNFVIGTAAFLAGPLATGTAAGQEESPAPPAAATRGGRFTVLLEPARLGRVEAALAGEVAEVAVAPGDEVKAGQVLLRLDRFEAEMALQLARARLERFKMEVAWREKAASAKPAEKAAKLAVEHAQARLAIRRKLLEKLNDVAGITIWDRVKAELELVDAEAAAKEAEARLAALAAGSPLADSSRQDLDRNREGLQGQEVEVHRLTRLLERHQVKAPFAGVVTRVHVAPGSQVDRGRALVEIADLSRLTATFPVAGELFAGLEVGQEVAAAVPFHKDLRLAGRVVRLGISAAGGHGNYVTVALEAAAFPKTMPMAGLPVDLVLAGKR